MFVQLDVLYWPRNQLGDEESSISETITAELCSLTKALKVGESQKKQDLLFFSKCKYNMPISFCNFLILEKWCKARLAKFSIPYINHTIIFFFHLKIRQLDRPHLQEHHQIMFGDKWVNYGCLLVLMKMDVFFLFQGCITWNLNQN